MVSAARTRLARTRAARRLAARQTQVALWWASLPTPKPSYFTALALEAELTQPMRAMAAPLRALGWRRIMRRTHGKYIVLWLPPTSPVHPRPPGCPRDPKPSKSPSP